ncbi:hypothetical protein [Alloacidobacterium sp.]|uniref:hypothetical protein n=1 Tax=Alloacidobacterium sp. TaxID=2951999 RepID=UPI002D4B3571|nr:hypothetical protein [Alloacidobacterium sp.]HYK36474.1 hypothetical protein [Alloacidobacterium sp.]
MNLKFGKYLSLAATMSLGIFVSLTASAAQLSGDARAAIPKDVQQLIVVDYRAMQNSEAAMNLKARVLPPELKQLETALKSSGLNDNHDVDDLAFAAFRTPNGGDSTKIVGIAQGQFSLPDILANFKKQKVKATKLRNNLIYPMGASGMLVSFLNPTTMVFGSSDSIKYALDARDGLAQSLLNNDAMMQQMSIVDTEPIWSILDQKGTQMMMRGVLGEAAQLADYDTVKKRLTASRYTMNFNNGVKFNLDVVTPDTFTAATMSSLLNAAAMYKKVSGTVAEKAAIDNTSIDSNSGTLQVRYSSSDSQFSSLLQSPLFQSVVH